MIGDHGKSVVAMVTTRGHVTCLSISKQFLVFSRSGYAGEAGRDVGRPG